MSAAPPVHWAKTPDGLYIAYQDVGSGPALVLVNGMYSHIEVYWEWPQFARFVERLATSLRVLHFDRRGTGMSDRVTDDPTLERSLDDVNTVLAAAGVERAAIYGWGEAATLAAMFAATYPEKTLAVLLDGDLRGKWAPDYPWGTKPDDEEEFVNRLYEIWGQDEHALEIGQLTCGDRPEDGPWHDEDFVRVHARLARFATTPGGFVAFTRTEYETDAREVARTIHVPAAVLVRERVSPSWLGYGAALGQPAKGSSAGVASAELSNRGVAEYNVSLIPGARLVTVPGAAVIPFFDEEEAYADAMIAFVKSVQHEEAELDRMLATVLFTDVVGSTRQGLRARRPQVDRAPRAPPPSRARDAGTLPRNGDRHDGRRLPRHLRRAGQSGEVRPGDLRRGEAARPRGAGRLPHRARSSCWAPTSAASPCTSAPGWPRSQGLPRSSSAPPSRTSSPAQGSPSTTGASTSSRACRRGGDCTWRFRWLGRRARRSRGPKGARAGGACAPPALADAKEACSFVCRSSG